MSSSSLNYIQAVADITDWFSQMGNMTEGKMETEELRKGHPDVTDIVKRAGTFNSFYTPVTSCFYTFAIKRKVDGGVQDVHRGRYTDFLQHCQGG